MHAVQINFFVHPEPRSPETLLDGWYSLVDIAEAVASAGVRVTVIQASQVPGCVERAGATFHFIAPDPTTNRLTQSPVFKDLISGLAPDALHIHGLGFPREVLELRRLVGSRPILLQDHAGRVPQFWKRGAWRRAASAVSGVSFCSRVQAEPFLEVGIFAPDTQIFDIPESTSRFVLGDRETARGATSVFGNPAVLWVGHLNNNKDPLTLLDAVSASAEQLPELQLWCCYGLTSLLGQVEKRIARDSRLRDRVHLLGQVPHGYVEQLMHASDLFVLSSQREGSNFSLIEALATGLTPLVTDIPSSRALIDDGRVGALWPCKDAGALAAALCTVWARQSSDTRAVVRDYFDAELSSSAIGRKFAAAYGALSTPATPASVAGSVS